MSATPFYASVHLSPTVSPGLSIASLRLAREAAARHARSATGPTSSAWRAVPSRLARAVRRPAPAPALSRNDDVRPSTVPLTDPEATEPRPGADESQILVTTDRR